MAFIKRLIRRALSDRSIAGRDLHGEGAPHVGGKPGVSTGGSGGSPSVYTYFFVAGQY